MEIDTQIQIVDRYNPATLAESPDYLFWQQSPPGGADLDTAEAFAHKLLTMVAERRLVDALRQEIERDGTRLTFTERRQL
jgi:hypothetical protein